MTDRVSDEERIREIESATDIFVNDQGTWRIAHVRAYFIDDATAKNVEAAQQDAPADRSPSPRGD